MLFNSNQSIPQFQFGKYEVLGELGHGTWPVYLAQDTLLGKTVALKVISCAEEDREQFREEARILDRLQALRHPHIVGFHGADFTPTGPEGLKILIATEWVDGTDLRRFLRDSGPLPPASAADIALKILGALGAAHGRHVLHRDVKPANVLIGSDGAVKLTDFGQARTVSTHSFADSRDGTYAYMAPEYFSPEVRTDHRADLWAVGVTLYEMVAGRRPFGVGRGDAGDVFVWADVIRTAAPAPLTSYLADVPPGLEAVLERALAKDADARYQSADAFAAELRALFPPDEVTPIPLAPSEDTPTRPALDADSLGFRPSPPWEPPRQAAQRVLGGMWQAAARLGREAGVVLAPFCRAVWRAGRDRLRQAVLRERLGRTLRRADRVWRGLPQRQRAVAATVFFLLAFAALAALYRSGKHASSVAREGIHEPGRRDAAGPALNSPRLTGVPVLHARTFADQGKAALQQHQEQAAAPLLQKAIALGDQTANTHVALGVAYCRLGDDNLLRGQEASALSHYRGTVIEAKTLLALGSRHPGQNSYPAGADYLVHLIRLRSVAIRHGGYRGYGRHWRRRGHWRHEMGSSSSGSETD